MHDTDFLPVLTTVSGFLGGLLLAVRSAKLHELRVRVDLLFDALAIIQAAAAMDVKAAAKEVK